MRVAVELDNATLIFQDALAVLDRPGVSLTVDYLAPDHCELLVGHDGSDRLMQPVPATHVFTSWLSWRVLDEEE